MRYDTTVHHFGECRVNSVHRMWPLRDEVELTIEEAHGGGFHGDEIHLYLNDLNAKRTCLGLLNIIGNDCDFHEELKEMMKMQRMPD
jgi:hypothetical protein